MSRTLGLPIIDLTSTDRLSTAKSIDQACRDCGFFYLINHGVEEQFLQKVFDASKRFFSLPIEEKTRLHHREYRGYTALYSELLDPSLNSKGDAKESFYVGTLDCISSNESLNQWPSEGILPNWRDTIEEYYKRVLKAGESLLKLIALALNLEESFFYDVGALSQPNAMLRLIRYPGDLGSSGEVIYGASAHSDYGMITLLATDGTAGLQVSRDKSKEPRVWEDVPSIPGAFIVNIGDLMERWTNCLFRSTLHRVMPVGQERYSVAFFIEPNQDCVVQCLSSCCNQSSPPRFPPVRSGDYLEERFRLTYGS